MGNRDNRTLFYIGSTIAVVLLLIVWALPGTSQKAGSSSWSALATIENDVEGEPQVSVSYLEGRARKGLPHRQKNNKISENTYQPSGSYVSSYTAKTEYHHPLVASTKFISKKDQKKKKKDKKSLAKVKKGTGKSSRRFGFDDDSYDGESSTLNNTPSQLISQNQVPAIDKKQEEQENINSVTYWEKPIFVDENVGMVSKLIESFQGSKVSNSVFYDIVTEMRQDERVVVREFGLLALTSTPSVRSFSELSVMKHTDPDADLRTAAGREVANYYLEQRLYHVVSALKLNSTDSSRTTYEALVVLNDATKKYSDSGTLEEGPQPTRVSSSKVEPRFEQALTVIDQEGLTESKDAKIKSQAQKTSTALTEFISTISI
jgi:hypothetical protein